MMLFTVSLPTAKINALKQQLQPLSKFNQATALLKISVSRVSGVGCLSMAGVVNTVVRHAVLAARKKSSLCGKEDLDLQQLD